MTSSMPSEAGHGLICVGSAQNFSAIIDTRAPPRVNSRATKTTEGVTGPTPVCALGEPEGQPLIFAQISPSWEVAGVGRTPHFQTT
jgi:hypothetical protein